MGMLDGKAVVITGGGGLLGSEFAKAMAKEGAKVLVNDIVAENAKAVVEAITKAGGQAYANTEPVAGWESAGRIIDDCLQRFGKIDALVTCAHKTTGKPIWELQEADLDLTLNIHVKGLFACAHHAAKHMKKQKSGSIITMSSRALNGHPAISTYAAAKGAIISGTMSWALELADHGVRVNCILPAAIRPKPGQQLPTHMKWFWEFTVENHSWYEPVPAAHTVAPLAVYLASDASNWVTGQIIFLSGDTLALMRHPREERFGFMPNGWSVGDIEKYFKATVGATLEMPGMGVPRYKWYEGVK